MAHELVGKSVKVITASEGDRTGIVMDISEGLIKMSWTNAVEGAVWVGVGQVEELTILETPIRTSGPNLPRSRTVRTGLP